MDVTLAVQRNRQPFNQLPTSIANIKFSAPENLMSDNRGAFNGSMQH